jgi:hypothetical protein
MDTEMINTLRSKYFLYINLGTHYCDEPKLVSFPKTTLFKIPDYQRDQRENIPQNNSLKPGNIYFINSV